MAALIGLKFYPVNGCFRWCREREAVRQLMEVAKDTQPGGPGYGAHVHVVHLSDGEDTLSMIKVHVAPILILKHGDFITSIRFMDRSCRL